MYPASLRRSTPCIHLFAATMRLATTFTCSNDTSCVSHGSYSSWECSKSCSRYSWDSWILIRSKAIARSGGAPSTTWRAETDPTWDVSDEDRIRLHQLQQLVI